MRTLSKIDFLGGAYVLRRYTGTLSDMNTRRRVLKLVKQASGTFSDKEVI